MNEGEVEEITGKSSTVAVNGDELLDSSVESRHSRWRTSLVAYVAMLGLLLLGLLTAIGHHLFYTYLNNREVDTAAIPQNWTIRIGNAIAYLFKTALVAAIAVAYAQGFWYVVRRRSLKIGSLDYIFGVLYNPFLLFNAKLLPKTSLLFGLAAVSWLLPISAVFSPGTLTGYPLP